MSDQVPHCPELNTPGNIGCICLACVLKPAPEKRIHALITELLEAGVEQRVIHHWVLVAFCDFSERKKAAAK